MFGNRVRFRSSGARSLAMLGIILAGLCVSSIRALRLQSPLLHDEAVYALRSRDLIHGWSNLSGSYFHDFRANGLPMVLSLVGRVVGFHAFSARAVSVLAACVVVACVWWLGRHWVDELTGLLAAGLLVLTAGFHATGTLVFADMPGAALAMLAIVIFVRDFDNGRLRSALILVPMLSFAATFVRFGAPFMIGPALLAVVIGGAPRLLQKRNRKLATEVAFVGLVVAGGSAFLGLSAKVTVGNSSVYDANRAVTSGKGLTVGSGFSDLWNAIAPWEGGSFWWSPVVAAIFLVGVLGALGRAVVVPSVRSVSIVLAISAVFSAAAVAGIVGQVAFNYLVLTLPFWALLAAVGLAPVVTWVRNMARDGSVVARSLAICLGIGFVILAVDAANSTRDFHQTILNVNGNYRSTALQAWADLGPNCVLITTYNPQVGYYSQCRVSGFASASEGGSGLDFVVGPTLRESAHFPGEETTVAILLVEQGKRQPDLEIFDESIDFFGPRLFEVGPENTPQHVWIQIIDPCVQNGTC